MEKDTIESGRYLVLNFIGNGHSASVYKAKDLYNGEIVALKEYKTYDVNNMKRLMEEVEREIDVLKHVTHPSLPKVFNILYSENKIYLVMEYVEGKNLQDILSDKSFKRKEVISIAEQILSAMYYLHSLDPPIVYRDLKPANIIAQKNGKIKLVDFGASKKFNRDVSADVMALGTPKFAAPEQYGDREGRGIYNTDIRTDIYGVGAVLYFLMTKQGINSKQSKTKKFIKRIIYGRKLFRVVNKATKLYPSKRYQGDIEMLVDLYR